MQPDAMKLVLSVVCMTEHPPGGRKRVSPAPRGHPTLENSPLLFPLHSLLTPRYCSFIPNLNSRQFPTSFMTCSAFTLPSPPLPPFPTPRRNPRVLQVFFLQVRGRTYLLHFRGRREGGLKDRESKCSGLHTRARAHARTEGEGERESMLIRIVILHRTTP